MELCEGNLIQWKKSHGQPSESILIQILKEVLLGLQFLHGKKMVHLDLKPGKAWRLASFFKGMGFLQVANILYKGKQFKIGDLGLTRNAIKKKNEEVVEGDGRYLAPEVLQASSSSTVDLTFADIFSLGASIMDMMLPDGLPCQTGEEWLKMRNNDFSLLDKMPQYGPKLKNIVTKMMDPDAEQRPSAKKLLTECDLFNEKKLELRWTKILRKKLEADIQKLEEIKKKRQENAFL